MCHIYLHFILFPHLLNRFHEVPGNIDRNTPCFRQWLNIRPHALHAKCSRFTSAYLQFKQDLNCWAGGEKNKQTLLSACIPVELLPIRGNAASWRVSQAPPGSQYSWSWSDIQCYCMCPNGAISIHYTNVSSPPCLRIPHAPSERLLGFRWSEREDLLWDKQQMPSKFLPVQFCHRNNRFSTCQVSKSSKGIEFSPSLKDYVIGCIPPPLFSPCSVSLLAFSSPRAKEDAVFPPPQRYQLPHTHLLYYIRPCSPSSPVMSTWRGVGGGAHRGVLKGERGDTSTVGLPRAHKQGSLNLLSSK